MRSCVGGDFSGTGKSADSTKDIKALRRRISLIHSGS